MALMELRAVTHLGPSEQVSWTAPRCKENVVPLGRHPRPELRQPASSLPPVASRVSVFMIFFFKGGFLSNAIMSGDGKNRLSSCWLFEITEGRAGIWKCSPRAVLQVLTMTFTHKMMGQELEAQHAWAQWVLLGKGRFLGISERFRSSRTLFYKMLLYCKPLN